MPTNTSDLSFKLVKTSIVAFGIMLLVACQPATTSDTQQASSTPAAALERVAPEAVGMDSQRLERVTQAYAGIRG